MRPQYSPFERFFSKVEFASSGCWLWKAGGLSDGYGCFRIGRRGDGSRRMILAHRFAYELFRGPIPAALTLDHLCRSRACVNPDHLEPVTMQTNILRGEHPEFSGLLTHCKHGHPFDVFNTYYYAPTKRRMCRTCGNQRKRAAYQAQKGA